MTAVETAIHVIDLYICDTCAFPTVTLQRVDGLVPPAMPCITGKCGGTMKSADGKCPQDLTPNWIWEEPTAREIKLMSKQGEEAKSYFEDGGLLRRAVIKMKSGSLYIVDRRGNRKLNI